MGERVADPDVEDVRQMTRTDVDRIVAVPGEPPLRDAVIVADGDIDLAALRVLVASRPGALVIGADGGARAALAAGIPLHLVVGDGDSLLPADRARLEATGVELRLSPTDKDESDTELCVLGAVAEGASRIAVIGALGGGRPEHSLANLLLLADPRLDGRTVTLHAGDSRIDRIGGDGVPGALEVVGARGDFVSLFAVAGEVTGVRTEGLRFPLRDETLTVGPARGLSNELLAPRARITTRDGRLLVVHTPRGSADATPQEGSGSS